MKTEILGAAHQDLLDGYRFYEKRAEAVGAYFVETLISDIDSLIVTAGVHPTHFGGYYRLLSKRFPFAVVYYRVENRVENQTAASTPCSTVAAAPRGSETGSPNLPATHPADTVP